MYCGTNGGWGKKKIERERDFMEGGKKYNMSDKKMVC